MSAPHPPRSLVRDLALSAGLVALSTGVSLLARGHLAEPDVVMLYLLGVVVAAARFGRAAALATSGLAVLAYDFFFVAPNFTFAVADERHLVTFAALFIVGLAISALADAARTAAVKAHTEELRSSLLSSVSHDLRTPLAAITGAATTLRADAASLAPAQREELLEAIIEEAERLERLVANLLDMSRLQAGQLEVKREWVPLEEVIGAALAQLEPRLGARPVRTTLPADLPLVSVDPVLLEQVFCNLLDNAARYTPSGSAITLAARGVPGAVEVTVDDEGPGLEPGSEAKVFEKFYRGHAEQPGAGLGLAICRAVLEAHRGTIDAGRSPAGGARFTLTLPLVGAPPSVPHEREESPS